MTASPAAGDPTAGEIIRWHLEIRAHDPDVIRARSSQEYRNRRYSMHSDPSVRPQWLAVSRAHLTRVGTLLDGGDRANAHGEADVLAHVARELIADVPRSMQYELVAIAELARLDFDEARRRWIDVSHRIRTRPGLADGL